MRSRSVSRGLPILVACALAVVALPRVALTVSTCRWSDFDGSMTVEMDGALTIERSGEVFLVDGAPCLGTGGTATVSTVQVVSVRDNSSGGRKITISLAGGPFAPGWETGPSPDLWFDLSSQGNQCNRVIIVGSTGGDTIRWGRAGEFEYINLNAAETADVDFDVRAAGTYHCIMALVFGGDGNDVVSGAGGLDTGLPANYSMRLEGGAGADRLIGGNNRNTLAGGLGNDSLIGGRRADALAGGNGADTLRGGFLGDVIKGGSGADTLIGGPDADVLVGGPGIDTCNGGSGKDEFWGCEKII